MSSLPYSILSKKDNDILPLISINEHQKFCLSFLKVYQSYKKKNNYKSDEEILQTDKNKRQKEIWKWYENLTEDERIKICTIKNKWLVNIFIQLYLVYQIDTSCYVNPTSEMEDLFKDHRDEENINSIKNKYNKSYSTSDDLNYYENFFIMECKNFDFNFTKKDTEKKEKEKKLLDNIRLLSLEENIIDTFTLKRDIIVNYKEFKELLNYFSNNQYFQNWILPFKVDNIYNFAFPHWMHNNDNLSFIQLIIGYIEQQILLNYEYFYFSKKLYDYSYSNLIIELYEENKKLVSFVKENYSYNNNNINKKEFISLIEIREIIRNLKKNEGFQKKMRFFHEIYFHIFKEVFKPKIIKKDFDLQIYKDLYEETKLGEELGIMKLLDHITFIQFNDVINTKDNVFLVLREKIVDDQKQAIVNELLTEDFLSSNSNKKKNKNKKKKKKNKEKENNNNKKEEDIKETSENNNNNSNE